MVVYKQKAPPFTRDIRANMGVIMGLVGVAIGLLILAIVFVIGPVVGYNVQSSVIVPENNNSIAWGISPANASTAALNGTELWQQNTPLIGSASIVTIAAVIIGVLLGSLLLQRK